MKDNPLLKSVGVAGFSAVVGALVAIAFLKIESVAKAQPMPDRVVARYVEDPFTQVAKMREQMRQRFAREDDGEGLTGIQRREDDHFVYFDLRLQDPKSTSLNSKVEDGYLNITGKVEKNQDEDNYFSSSFSKTFPVPDGVDAEKMQTEADGDKVTFKFPKVSV